MRSLALSLVLIMLVLGVSCRRHDVRTVEIDVPGLKNEKCKEIIFNKLARVQGIMPDYSKNRPNIDFDLEKRLVIVEYDSMQLAIKNIEFHIADAGFQAGKIPPNLDAVQKLPPECK